VAGPLTDTLKGLLAAAASIEADAPTRATLEGAVARGGFRPDEDEAIGFWFARFLSVRESLWAVIEEVLESLAKPPDAIRNVGELRIFLVGYAAVCLLVRIDRFMLFDVAFDSVVQRKLNEAFPEYRVPRKQYTTIFSGFVDQANVLAIREAMLFAKRRRAEIDALNDDADIGFIVRQLGELEASLNPSKRRYIKRALDYLGHKWRRRGVVSARNLLASVMEGLGRTASEFCDMDTKQVTDDVRASIAQFLEPGDVLVTRHAKALTNLFLPGYWPHVALYIGIPEQRDAAGVRPDAGCRARWVGDVCVLEARKDGVRLRPLEDTLNVDMLVVLRPTIDTDEIRAAIERALQHEGKLYNFDFDFFNSDRLVCTELVYRAYDGIGGLEFPLVERAGRKTLSAEDLLDFALDTGAFLPVAVFGVGGDSVVFGERVSELVQSSYRSKQD